MLRWAASPIFFTMFALPSILTITSTEYSLMIYEEPPGARVISYCGSECMVELPWVYFSLIVRGDATKYLKKIKLCTVFVTSSFEQLEGPRDSIYAPFPNTYDNGKVCWGRQELPELTNRNICYKISEIFWASPFNTDLSNDPRQLRENYKKSVMFFDMIASQVTHYDVLNTAVHKYMEKWLEKTEPKE